MAGPTQQSLFPEPPRPVNGKVAYVNRQPHQTGHHCHWPGCEREVKPALWGCRAHWFRLPSELRARIWATYRPGQERDKRPSQAYLDVAKAVQQWIEAHAAPEGR